MVAREQYTIFMMGGARRRASSDGGTKPSEQTTREDAQFSSGTRSRVSTSFENMDRGLLEAIVSDLEHSVAKG